MSVPRGCRLIERNPGEWYCVVAHDEHDYYFASGCNVYGPRTSDDLAYEAMSSQESNPGSLDTVRHGELTDFDKRLIDNASPA